MVKRKLKVIDLDNSFLDKLVALYFSLFFLLASFLSAFLSVGLDGMWKGFLEIVLSPAPLITDYFALGTLSGAFLNAFLCGISCTLLMFLLRAKCSIATFAGFFLVTGHSFYGLNALNMWPPILGVLFYSLLRQEHFSDNLASAFYTTAFAPFFSEILFRYPLTSFSPVVAVLATTILSLFLGIAAPALLKGAKLLHREMSLYNGGLAFGLLGMLVYSFMYNIMGVKAEKAVVFGRVESTERFNFIFCNCFFLVVFLLAIAIGWYFNGGSFRGYRKLLRDPGFKSDFLTKYGDGVTMINLGLYGLMMVLYFDLAILLTDGVGWTGAVCGIVLAAVTFSASGQHPKNVWPILLGYAFLQVFVWALSSLWGREMTWSLSTQAYMNGAAFATGLCPFTGRYGKRYGFIAGMTAAVLCTATLSMHGGFMLYNAGLTAGMAALILSPMIDHYRRDEKEYPDDDNDAGM